MRVLLVEDDDSTANVVVQCFTKAGFEIAREADGQSGLERARKEPFDTAIIDIMLPKLDGISLIRQLRSEKISFPVIVLSARGSVESRITGLEAGGDDYLPKPFSLGELVARVKALLRRGSEISDTTALTVGDLTMDLVNHAVTRGGVQIPLQKLEYQLLEYLMRNTGVVVSRDTIMEHVWNYDFDTGTNIVDARVCRLRDKIDKPFERKLIKTIRGFGYVLE
jgi:two-component system OmpR family response regulator